MDISLKDLIKWITETSIKLIESCQSLDMGTKVACTGYVQSLLYIIAIIALVVINIRLGLVKPKDTRFSIKNLYAALKHFKIELIIVMAFVYNLYLLGNATHATSSILYIVFFGYLFIGSIWVAACNQRTNPLDCYISKIICLFIDGFIVAASTFILAGALPFLMRKAGHFDNSDYFFNPPSAAAILILPFFLVLKLKQAASNRGVIWVIYGSFIALMLYFVPGVVNEQSYPFWFDKCKIDKLRFTKYFILHYSLLMCWLFHTLVLPEKHRLQTNANAVISTEGNKTFLKNLFAFVAPFIVAGLLMGGMLYAIADSAIAEIKRVQLLFIIIGHGCIGGSIGLVLYGLETNLDNLHARINQLVIFYKNIIGGR